MLPLGIPKIAQIRFMAVLFGGSHGSYGPILQPLNRASTTEQAILPEERHVEDPPEDHAPVGDKAMLQDVLSKKL